MTGFKFDPPQIRVRYAETDQMGVAYHAHYLVWCEVARTDYLRQVGSAYRDVELSGIRLAVVDASLKYRRSARYDDLVAIDCWVRSLASRKVEFGYHLCLAEEGTTLATARTSLIALDANNELARIPENVRDSLVVVPDPVRI